MSDDRGLLDRLVEGIAPGAGADVDPRAATFTRGLVVGALVGAAIAGSTIWQRRQAKREAVPHDAAVPQVTGDAPVGRRQSGPIG